ncbi:hypothetical protein, partial [Xanthomonas sacchari]
MIVLEGASALSPFRRARLETRLQSLVPGVRIVGAWHVYFLDGDDAGQLDLVAARRILQAQDAPAPAEA